MRAIIGQCSVSYDGERLEGQDVTFDEKQQRLYVAAQLVFDDIRHANAGNFWNFEWQEHEIPSGGGRFSHTHRGVQAVHFVEQFFTGPWWTDDTMFLPLEPSAGRLALLHLPLTPARILASLAASGVETALPSVQLTDRALIAEIRDKCKPERAAYLNSLRSHIAECKQRVAAGEYEDALEYARYKTDQEVLAAAVAYRRAIEGGPAHWLKHLVKATTDEVPSLGAAVVTENAPGAAVAMLRACAGAFSAAKRERMAAEANPRMAYLYRLFKLMRPLPPKPRVR